MMRWWQLGCLLVALCSLAVGADAAQLAGADVRTEGGATLLRLHLDRAQEYRVYELSAPHRLVLRLPGATLADRIQPPVVSQHGALRSIRWRQDEQGVRIELALSETAQYRVHEQGADLELRLAEGKSHARGGHAIIKDIVLRNTGHGTEVHVRGEHMNVNHNLFVTEDGKSIIVDFWQGESRLAREHFSYDDKYVRAITVGSARQRLRMVVTLATPAPAHRQIARGEGEWVLQLGARLPQGRGGQQVEAVDYVPNGNSPKLVIRTASTDANINVHQRKGLVIVDIAAAKLARKLERTLDVSAFPGPVGQIDSYQHGKGVRVVARLREEARVTSFQSGNVLTLTFHPVQEVGKVGERLPYHGRKVSFDFKDIDIRNALRLIAEMSDLNIIMGDDVGGRLTMRLVDVPWDQALDLILAAKGLGKVQQGNVLRIAPLDVLQREYKARMKAREATQDMEPLVTEFIHLGYASVEDIKAMLESARKQGGGGKAEQAAASGAPAPGTSESSNMALLSPRGSLLMDKRSNILIVTDTAWRVDNIKRLVAELDKPVQQVLIEARIVEATNAFTRDLGVRWGGTYANPAAVGKRFGHTLTGGIGGNLVDLPAQGPAGAISYSLGTLSNALNLNLELSAAEADQKIKVLSNPRVLTSNNQQARIEQIIEIPFTQTTAQGGILVTSTVTREAKLSLIATPQITADNKIIMNLEIHKDTPQANTLVPGGDPIIDKKLLTTKLLVDNGETVVLGGIYSKTVGHTKNSVPFFSEIPLLGKLFQRNQKEDTRVELMLFITPTLVGSAGEQLSGRGG